MLFFFNRQAYRAMVGVDCRRNNRRIDNAVFESIAHHAVINPPTLVVGSCIGSETPPRVGIFYIFVDVAKAVGETTLDKAVNPLTLLGKKTRRLCIANGAVNINLTMTNIVVAAQHKERTLFL